MFLGSEFWRHRVRAPTTRYARLTGKTDVPVSPPTFQGKVTLQEAAARLCTSVESLLETSEVPVIVQVPEGAQITLRGPSGLGDHDLMRRPDFLELSGDQRTALRTDGEAVMQRSAVGYSYRKYAESWEYRRLPAPSGKSKCLHEGPAGDCHKLWASWEITLDSGAWRLVAGDLFLLEDSLNEYGAGLLVRAADILGGLRSSNASRALRAAAWILASGQWDDYPTEPEICELLTVLGVQNSTMVDRAAKLLRPDSVPPGRPLKKSTRHMRKVRKEEAARFLDEVQKTLGELPWGSAAQNGKSTSPE
jgi:hypothetical protein